MALAKLINQLGLAGFGPDHYQTDMLAEHGTHTGAVVPLYDRDAIAARGEHSRRPGYTA